MRRFTFTVLVLGLVVGAWQGPASAEETAGTVTAGNASNTGLHTWIDFVSTSRGKQIRHGDAMVRRLANSGNFGFTWANDLLAVRVTDSLAEYGQFTAAGGKALINMISPLTNPTAVFSVRPVKMLRFDVEADLLWAFDMQNGPGDFSYTSVFGGAFAVWEPLARFVGDQPLLEVALGAKGGKAWTDADQAPAGQEFKGSRLLTGLRFNLVLPIRAALGPWTDAGLYLGAGYFVDPIGDYDAGKMFKMADVEWTLGMRWFM